MFLSDRGPGFVGKIWQEFSDTYSFLHICVPKSAPHSNGLIERQVGLLKEGFKCARERNSTMTGPQLMEMVTTTRNLIPSIGTGVAPLTAICGRSDIFTALEEMPALSDLVDHGGVHGAAINNVHVNLKEMCVLRTHLMAFEADRIVSICQQRQVRAGTNNPQWLDV